MPLNKTTFCLKYTVSTKGCVVCRVAFFKDTSEMCTKFAVVNLRVRLHEFIIASALSHFKHVPFVCKIKVLILTQLATRIARSYNKPHRPRHIFDI